MWNCDKKLLSAGLRSLGSEFVSFYFNYLKVGHLVQEHHCDSWYLKRRELAVSPGMQLACLRVLFTGRSAHERYSTPCRELRGYNK